MGVISIVIRIINQFITGGAQPCHIGVLGFSFVEADPPLAAPQPRAQLLFVLAGLGWSAKAERLGVSIAMVGTPKWLVYANDL